MAASDMASQFSETVKSLDLDTVPDKLKCAICSKLALNAFKLPCCGQSICDSCQNALPASCPVCEHSPVTPEMCTPHKALRNTLKAYLKTAEKRLAEERLKSEASQPRSTTVPIRSTQDAPQVSEPAIKQSENEHPRTVGTSAATESSNLQPNEPEQQEKAQNEAANLQGSYPADPTSASLEDARSRDMLAEGERSRPGSEPVVQNSNLQKRPDQPSDNSQTLSNAISNGTGQLAGFSNTQNTNFGFGNMDYNQMLQNGLPGGMNFGMMGVPGMNLMDPMAQMSQMYGGFGGQNMGVGMNGMGMNFNANQGTYGGWSGQNNMWQSMQNMSNQNAFANGIGGDFGSNSGYGYNFPHQGNFQQQQYQNNDFQMGYSGHGYGRGGRGRGRGYGRGRGTFNNFQNHGNTFNHQQSNSANQQQVIPQVEDQVSSRSTDPDQQIDLTKPTYGERAKTLDDEFAPGGLDEVKEALLSNNAEESLSNAASDPGPEKAENGPETVPQEEIQKDAPEVNGHLETNQIESVPAAVTAQEESTKSGPTPVTDVAMTDEPVSMAPPSAPLGPAAQFAEPSKDFGFRGRGRGGFAGRGRGYTNGSAFTSIRPDAPPNAPTEPKGPGVVGAPTGPKAMRAGFAGPSSRGRGIGIQIVGRASMAGQESQSQDLPSANSELSPKYRERSRSRSRSQSRSRSPSHRRSRRHRRRDSDYYSDAEDEKYRRREHRHRRSKHDIDYDDDDAYVNGNGHHSTSSDPESSSRRKDREKSARSSHPHKSSHRSRRHRSRSRDKDRHGDEDYHHSSDLRSGVDKDVSSSAVESESHINGHRRHKHRSSHRDDSRDGHRDRKRSRRDYELGEYDEDGNETGHRSRRQKREDDIKIPTGPRSMAVQQPAELEKDPHALEREARNRERMLKEQQRRDATNAEESRRKDSRQERAFGGRRVSYKFEASPSRIEQEREAARWR